MRGSVNIYVYRNYKDFNKEKSLAAKVLEAWEAKKDELGPVYKVRELLKFVKGLNAKDVDYVNERFEFVRDDKVMYFDSFLTQELKGFTNKDIKKDYKIFDQRGVLVLTFIARLVAGMVFGEKGLDDKIPRTATILCDTDCEFGLIMKDDYDLILKEASRLEAEVKRQFFTEHIFKNMVTGSIATKVSYDFYKCRYHVQPNHYIFRQGEAVNFIYVMESGKILVTREESIEKPSEAPLIKSASVSHVFKLAEFNDSLLFGYEDLYTKSGSRYYNAIALNPCVLLKVSREAFNQYIELSMTFRDYINVTAKERNANRISLLNRLLEEFVKKYDSKENDEENVKEVQQFLLDRKKSNINLLEKIKRKQGKFSIFKAPMKSNIKLKREGNDESKTEKEEAEKNKQNLITFLRQTMPSKVSRVVIKSQKEEVFKESSSWFDPLIEERDRYHREILEDTSFEDRATASRSYYRKIKLHNESQSRQGLPAEESSGIRHHRTGSLSDRSRRVCSVSENKGSIIQKTRRRLREISNKALPAPKPFLSIANCVAAQRCDRHQMCQSSRELTDRSLCVPLVLGPPTGLQHLSNNSHLRVRIKCHLKGLARDRHNKSIL